MRRRPAVPPRIALVTTACVVAVCSPCPRADAAGTVGCGVVATSVKLGADLDCPGQHGLMVGADNITIDLGGHTLKGDGTPFKFGIDNGAGHAGVTVKNGTIAQFAIGVYLQNASGNVVSGVTVRDCDTGINATGTSSGNKIQHVVLVQLGISGIDFDSDVDGNMITLSTIVGASTAGIEIDGANNVVSKTTVSSSGVGILLTAEAGGNLLTANTVSASVLEGIVLVGAGMVDNKVVSNRVEKNRVEGSGADGIRLANADLGTVSRNVVVGSHANGVRIGEDSDGNTVAKNVAIGNAGSGIFVTSDCEQSLITSNTTSRNYNHGIDVDDTNATTRVGKNTATLNRLKGIEADPDVTDLGGNKARLNGDPEQCSVAVFACD